jgi:hypothetical protein
MVVSSEPHTVPYFGRAVAVRHAYGGKILPACAAEGCSYKPVHSRGSELQSRPVTNSGRPITATITDAPEIGRCSAVVC